MLPCQPAQSALPTPLPLTPPPAVPFTNHNIGDSCRLLTKRRRRKKKKGCRCMPEHLCLVPNKSSFGWRMTGAHLQSPWPSICVCLPSYTLACIAFNYSLSYTYTHIHAKGCSWKATSLSESAGNSRLNTPTSSFQGSVRQEPVGNRCCMTKKKKSTASLLSTSICNT